MHVDNPQVLNDRNTPDLQEVSAVNDSNETPVLSIIVPVYNTEKYLKDCLDSILAQEFADFEVLCVDDGSTDRSPQIIDDYARRDSRIKPFHITNQGVSHARNYALERAVGTYIGFVDSDDWIDSDHFSILMKGFDDPSVDLSCSQVALEKEDTSFEIRRQEISRDYAIKELSKKETFEAFFFDDGIRGYGVAKIFKKEKIRNVFNENIALAEDLLFCCQYALNVNKTICAKRQTYRYRKSDSDGAFLFKTANRITGLKAEILIAELLLQDRDLSKCSNCAMRYLFDYYVALVSHHSHTRNVEALTTLRNYKPEVHKYLRLYCSSRDCSNLEKLKALVKVNFPKLSATLYRSFKVLLMK